MGGFSITEEVREFMDSEQRESERLYGLTNRWLGDALLQLSRVARCHAHHLKPSQRVYDNTFIWQVVPEIAKRLGVRRFLPSERTDREITQMSDGELREMAMLCIGNISLSRYWQLPGWSQLLKEPADGNGVVFAVDRLSPGSLERPDSIVRRLQEVAHNRGVQYDGVWTPGMRKCG